LKPPFDSLQKHLPIKHRVRWSGSGLPFPDGSLLLDDFQGPEKKTRQSTNDAIDGLGVFWFQSLVFGDVLFSFSVFPSLEKKWAEIEEVTLFTYLQVDYSQL